MLDVIPHEDIESRRSEIGSALFAATRRPLDPAMIGAIISSAGPARDVAAALSPATLGPAIGAAEAPSVRCWSLDGAPHGAPEAADLQYLSG